MRIAIALLALSFAGCSTAGPFVTNVSSAGPNRLLVEKCHVELNAFVGYVTNKDCTTTTIATQ